MSERWKAVPDFEGAYEVSDLGRVRSLNRVVVQRHAHGALMERRLRGRVLVQTADPDRYFTVGLHGGGLMQVRRVHRLVMETFVGLKPDGMHVCHSDGNRQNNVLENLRYGTPIENGADAVRHGSMAHSERHHRAKLNRRNVAAIRAARGKVRQIDLAAKFGVPQSDISAIQLGKVWRHV